MSKRQYFILAVQYERGDAYSVAFGDYVRSVVADEREDSYSDCHSARIIRTAPDQASIDAAIRELNAPKTAHREECAFIGAVRLMIPNINCCENMREEFGEDDAYCLDRPDFCPAGSMHTLYGAKTPMHTLAFNREF